MSYARIYSVKKVLFFCLISLIKRCIALYFNTTVPDLMQHATPHGSSPTITSRINPWPSMSPDFNGQARSMARCIEVQEYDKSNDWFVSHAGQKYNVICLRKIGGVSPVVIEAVSHVKKKEKKKGQTSAEQLSGKFLFQQRSCGFSSSCCSFCSKDGCSVFSLSLPSSVRSLSSCLRTPSAFLCSFSFFPRTRSFFRRRLSSRSCVSLSCISCLSFSTSS